MDKERKKKEKNIIFHYLIEMKREREQNRVDEVFCLKIMLSPFFFSFQIGGKKREEMVLRKEV